MLGIEKLNNTRSGSGRKVNIERSTISVLSFGGIPLASVSLSLGHQLRHPHKVIRRSYPPSRQLRSLGSPISVFRNPPTVLAQPKISSILFRPLTDAVTLMACGAPVNGRTALAPSVGCHMGNDLSAAQKINKAVSVVVLVRSQRFDPPPFRRWRLIISSAASHSAVPVA